MFWNQIWVTVAWDADSGHSDMFNMVTVLWGFYSNRIKEVINQNILKYHQWGHQVQDYSEAEAYIYILITF